MQEQIEYDLPVSGKKVIVKGFVSGRIQSEIQAIVNKGIGIEADFNTDDPNEVKVGTNKMRMNLSAQQEADDRALELMLISLDGSADDVFNRVMELPAGDTGFITEKINEITKASAISDTKKKS